ncbi:MAG: TolC family protein [Pedobacter sp.]
MNDKLLGKPPRLSIARTDASPGRQAGRAVFYLRSVIVLSILAFALPTLAFDFVAPFADPLQTLPKIMETGVSLPGDGKPVTCPVSKDFSKPLTLAEAVDLSLCNNPQIKSAWASIKVQAGSVGEARAAYLPTLSGTTNFMRTHSAYPGSSVAATTTEGETIYGTLSWRLFDFGGREANRKYANSLLVAAIAHHDATLQKTLADVVQAYFDAHTAKALLLAKEQNEAIAKNTLETAQRREARGAVARSDTLQATTALAKASLEKNRAIGAYNKALSVLVYTLGAPTQTSIILPDDLTDSGSMESKNLEDWLKITAETHPAILSARAQLESSKLKTTSTRSEGLPTVDFSASYYQNGYPGQGLSTTESQVNTLGISISFPFFDGFSRTYKIRGAEAQVEQKKAELQDIEHSALMEVVKAHADAAASLQNLQASENLLNAAQESLNTSQRKYEKGAADILEILNTQAALSDAKQERIRSLAEWSSARLRLLANVGVMGREEGGR